VHITKQADLGRELGIEAVCEARQVDVESLGDNLHHGTDARVGACGTRPVVPSMRLASGTTPA
jgi:hypothetical protein